MRVWNYSKTPPAGGDARKLVTLDEDQMRWVGIRAFHSAEGRWYNGNEPERATIIAWRDLEAPAKSFYLRGQFKDMGDAIVTEPAGRRKEGDA
jgi:hypothetical protein